MVWLNDFFVPQERLRKETMEEVVNSGAKLNCLTEDEGLCYPM